MSSSALCRQRHLSRSRHRSRERRPCQYSGCPGTPPTTSMISGETGMDELRLAVKASSRRRSSSNRGW